MKKLLIATALLAASTTAASAACGNSSLNGRWALANGGNTAHQILTVLNGNLGGFGPISQNSTTCRVTLLVGGTTFVGHTENVASAPAANKPNLMTLRNANNLATGF